MGSSDNASATNGHTSIDPNSLPPATSPLLILTTPTPSERLRTWALTYPMWGPALSESDYLTREAYLTTVPLARDGGITHWILTVEGMKEGERPKFYAKHGWAPFASCHVAWKPQAVEGGGEGLKKARVIGYHELAELCVVDEKLLRGDLMRMAREDGKTHAAILPELDTMLWHLMREDFMTKAIFGRTPAIRGAVAGEPGKRVWAVWMRGYYGGLKKMEGNTLHILRVVMEDPSQPDEQLMEGFREIIQIAQAEAAEWKTQDVQVWNPTPKLKGLIVKCGIEFEFVDRDKDSIASLMWYGEEATEDIDWVANEKYAWC
ncbi:hypothetical protein N0V88_006905 [Collariella sp. IMI 366227]|nr:hypothetical protein N0V88_006905 [Collariella sp. IMI 366227]